MKDVFINPRKYVPHWFRTKGYKIRPNGAISGEDPASLFASLWLDYCEDFLAESIKNRQSGRRLSEKDMQKAYEEFLRIEQQRVRAVILASLKYTNTTDHHLKNWLVAITGSATDFQISVIKHILWQVKRKINNLKVVYHLCPIFYGEQGGGKSTAIFKLLNPLIDFTVDFSPAEVIDTRNARSLNENYLCVFDEMAGMQRVEMESFKRIITAEYVTYRPMRSNNYVKVMQNTTFIGISNKSLPENIYDTTGLRRFVEFKCLEKCDWSLLNTINVQDIWESIDENIPEGYVLSVIDELGKHQKEMQPIEEVEQFLKEQLVFPIEGTKTVSVLAVELYNHFIVWRNANGYEERGAIAINSFGMKLRRKGLPKGLQYIDGKEKVVYYINDASHIFGKKADKQNNIVFMKKEKKDGLE